MKRLSAQTRALKRQLLDHAMQSISIQDKKINSNLKMLAVNSPKLPQLDEENAGGELSSRSRHEGAAGRMVTG